MSHISDPQFLVVHAYIHVFTGSLCQFAGVFVWGFVWGFCLEGFIRGGFCPPPLLSEYIHYNRKLIITFNFRFHMHERNFKCVMPHALGPPPPPVTNCHTFSDLLLPSSVTYFMNGPFYHIRFVWFNDMRAQFKESNLNSVHLVLIMVLIPKEQCT